MINLDLNIPTFEKVTDAIKNQTNKMKTLNKRTISDVKTKASPIVKNAITTVYGIKPNEIAKESNMRMDGKSKGAYAIKGVDVRSLRLVYTGRALTPRVFHMTPTKRGKRKKYTVKAEIFKGHKYPLSEGDNSYDTPIFLAPNPNKPSVILPFQRKEDQTWRNKKRTPITVIHRTSVPQMIENEGVKPVIKKRLEEVLLERIEYHAKQLKGE